MCDYRYALEMRLFWVIQMGLNHFGLSWSHKYLQSENLSQLWSKRGVTTEGNSEWCDVAGFEDAGREPWNKEWGELEKLTKIKPPRRAVTLTKPWVIQVEPCQSSELQNCKINSYCFKPLHLCPSITTATT